ncbi:MAG TPA: ATP-dependent DNA helicase [Acidimicrobiales bacterium]|nr:ATP-dependent DNA helicase [Acidimicrobiales bacterium]
MTGPDDVRAAMAKVTAALPAGEERPGQVEMATAVARTIDDGGHLIVQAGTGTGKSLAYLVPAILSGSKVIVATATKALQDQLATKDLPFLARHLGQPFEFAVLKGRSNYLCWQRAKEVAGGDDEQLTFEPAADVGELGREVAAVLEWAGDSPTGDRAEMPFEPRPKVWAALSVGARECPGVNQCPSGGMCFAEAARQRAAQADVVVVNTHLYCTHLASDGYVLPEHDVVVFDEAHELEDIAATTLGLELGAGRLKALARTSRALVARDDVNLIDGLDDAASRVDDVLVPWRGRRLPDDLGEEVSAAVALAGERARQVVAAVRKEDGDAGRKARALQSGGHLVGDLALVAAMPEGHVAWVEGPAHAPVLKLAAVDVAGLMAARLWGERRTVLTSATVPPNIRLRLGIDADASEQLDVGSPFPYADNAMLYCAAALPDPRKPEYEAAMHDELEALIRAAGGRTLALFTSWRAMEAAAAALAERLPPELPVLTQSDLPKPALVEAFSAHEPTSLFATMGFWQGIDVPGPSLSLVTLDRIPFPRPDEPLTQARRDKAGAGAFRLVDLPRAATLLAQGAGRLIRSATDRGVVAVLDPRLATATYRWDLVRALPPMRRTKNRADVESFLTAALSTPQGVGVVGRRRAPGAAASPSPARSTP